jgi:hypothetical protein
MRSLFLTGAFLATLLCFYQCRQKEVSNEVYIRADSLLGLTLALQLKIGSPEIQRMHDFQEEIDSDLAFLDSYPDEDTSVNRYRELYNGLGQCMKACSQYHEEAYMLESSLREIMEQAGLKKSGPGALEKRLEFETDNYRDLSTRIDSSLNQAIRQAEIFYILKPGIDRIREQFRLP